MATTDGNKILRIGIIQHGKIIEERLLKKRQTVTVGQSVKNTFVLPDERLPKSYPLFEVKGKRYCLNFRSTMKGRMSIRGQVFDLKSLSQSKFSQKMGNQFTVALDEKARGKVVVGDVTMLFQFVSPPPKKPKQKLPPALQVGFFAFFYMIVLDYWLFASLIVSASVQVGCVLYLEVQDWPEPKPLMEEEPDRWAQYIQPRMTEMEPEPEPEPIEEEGDGEGDTPVKEEKKEEVKKKEVKKKRENLDDSDPVKRARAKAERKKRLSKQVENKTILHVLGAPTDGNGDSGYVYTLDGGEVAQKDIEDALSTSTGGFTTASSEAERSGLRSTGSSDAEGSGELTSVDVKGSKRLDKANEVKTVERKERKVKARVSIRSPEKMVGRGKLNKDSVKRVIKQRQRQLQACYERELKKDPSLNGKVIVRWTIGPAGRVTDAKVVKNTLKTPVVGRCVAEKIKRWRFDKPKGGSVTVTKRFIFDAQ